MATTQRRGRGVPRDQDLEAARRAARDARHRLLRAARPASRASRASRPRRGSCSTAGACASRTPPAAATSTSPTNPVARSFADNLIVLWRGDQRGAREDLRARLPRRRRALAARARAAPLAARPLPALDHAARRRLRRCARWRSSRRTATARRRSSRRATSTTCSARTRRARSSGRGPRSESRRAARGLGRARRRAARVLREPHRVLDRHHQLPARRRGRRAGADLPRARPQRPDPHDGAVARRRRSRGRAVAAADELAEALRANPEVAWLRAGADPEFLRSVYELTSRSGSTSCRTRRRRSCRRSCRTRGCAPRRRRCARALALPTSPLLKQIVTRGSARRVPEPARAAARRASRRSRRATACSRRADGRWAVILLATKHSAFDAARAARRCSRRSRASSAELRARLRRGPRARAEPARTASPSTPRREIRGDASWISTLSCVGVALLSSCSSARCSRSAS